MVQMPLQSRDRRQVDRRPRVPVERRREIRQPARGPIRRLDGRGPADPGRHLDAGDTRPRAGPRSGVAHPQVAAVQLVAHREESGTFPRRQPRHLGPVRVGKHTAVMRLDVADDRQPAAVPDAVQRAVEHGQPSAGAELFGDVGLGVAHQALKLLAGGLDVGAVDRVRFPAPPVAVVGQAGRVSTREDGRASDGHPVEAGGSVLRDEHGAGGPATGEARADVALRAGVGQARLGAHRAVHESQAVRAAPDGRAVGLECSGILDELALEGMRRIVLRLESDAVSGVEGLDAQRADPVRIVRASHLPESHSVAGFDACERTLLG